MEKDLLYKKTHLLFDIASRLASVFVNLYSVLN